MRKRIDCDYDNRNISVTLNQVMVATST